MPSAFVTFNAVITAFISLGGAVTNSLIIYAFVNTKRLRTVNNTFLFQLAIVDLTKSVMILSVKAYKQLSDKTYVLGIYCPISGLLSTITFVQSALLLAAIAVVRYFKIVKPLCFDKVFSNRRVLIYSCSISIATFLLGMLPILGVGEYKFSKHHGVCFAHWSQENLIFRSLFYVYSMGLCYPVLIYCYARIFTKLRKHKKTMVTNIRSAYKVPFKVRKVAGADENNAIKKDEDDDYEKIDVVESNQNADEESKHEAKHVKKQSKRMKNFEEAKQGCSHDGLQDQAATPSGCKFSTTDASSDLQSRRKSAKLKRALRNEIRVTKLMFLIVVAYSICWLPAFFVNVFMMSETIQVSDTVLYLVITILDAKVFVNPLIYGLGNHQFRQDLSNLLFTKNSVEGPPME
eukprot:gene7954-8811_t